MESPLLRYENTAISLTPLLHAPLLPFPRFLVSLFSLRAISLACFRSPKLDTSRKYFPLYI